MIKKIVSLVLSLLLCFGLLACSQVKSDEKDPLQNIESNLEENNLSNENSDEIEQEDLEMLEILKHFDLTDPKLDEPIREDDEFHLDRVSIIMKKTPDFKILELKDFRLDNAESLVYYFARLDENRSDYLQAKENHRQLVVIYLKNHGKEEVLNAVYALRKLEFVKCAQPKYIDALIDL